MKNAEQREETRKAVVDAIVNREEDGSIVARVFNVPERTVFH
jgi:hypothetical protein